MHLTLYSEMQRSARGRAPPRQNAYRSGALIWTSICTWIKARLYSKFLLIVFDLGPYWRSLRWRFRVFIRVAEVFAFFFLDWLVDEGGPFEAKR